jgi:glycerophosphoryl diester phosphodiesterase
MAHRGFSLDGLENTMTAFGAAVDLGMTHVETDVHATSDGVLVAFHDTHLDRVTDATGRITGLTWQRLRSVRVGGVEHVPRLDEVLGTWPGLRVNIDVKDWTAVAPLAEVIARTGAVDRVCVSSFDDRRSAAVRGLLGSTLAARLATSPGQWGVARWRLASLLPGGLGARRAVRDGSPAVAVQVPAGAGPLRVVTQRSVRVAHANGLQVHVWTVNEAAQMHQLLDLGVDGLITDRSDTLLDVLRERAVRPA